jgi:hypothetical protein
LKVASGFEPSAVERSRDKSKIFTVKVKGWEGGESPGGYPGFVVAVW